MGCSDWQAETTDNSRQILMSFCMASHVGIVNSNSSDIQMMIEAEGYLHAGTEFLYSLDSFLSIKVLKEYL